MQYHRSLTWIWSIDICIRECLRKPTVPNFYCFSRIHPANKVTNIFNISFYFTPVLSIFSDSATFQGDFIKVVPGDTSLSLHLRRQSSLLPSTGRFWWFHSVVIPSFAYFTICNCVVAAIAGPAKKPIQNNKTTSSKIDFLVFDIIITKSSKCTLVVFQSNSNTLCSASVNIKIMIYFKSLLN